MLSQITLVKVRKAIERTYTGVCTIVERQELRDEMTKITNKNAEVTVVENQPCKLSYEKVSPAVPTETAAALTQGIKLFLSPEIMVKSGSKIIVEQNGTKAEYFASGEPAIYPTHVEVTLELFKEWA